MQSVPKESNDDREVIHFDARIAGQVKTIAIDRESIEDYLGVESTTSADRVRFVTQNMPMLCTCASRILADAPDATGLMLKASDLPARESQP